MDMPFGSNYNDQQFQQALQTQAEVAANRAAPAPTLCLVKNALNGGELAPDMDARFDLPRYQLGCEFLLNMVPMPGGGLTKRPGFTLVSGTGEIKAEARLIPFSYSSTHKMMLLFLAKSDVSSVSIMDRDGTSCDWWVCSMPYINTELADLSWTQAGKNIYLAHPNHPPAKLVWDGASFTYEEINFKNEVPIPDIELMWVNGDFEGSLGEVSYCVTAIDDETGRESLPCVPQTREAPYLSTTTTCDVSIIPVDGCSEYRIYKLRGGVYGFIGRITENEEGIYIFKDMGYDPDISDTPPQEQEFFAEPGKYPSIVFIHQQRLGWAASDEDPLTIWMSQTSNYECMDSKTPPQDDDALEATLASNQANRILWAVSDRSGLALGTEGEEWYMTGASGEGAAVTPNSISFQPQTRYGTQPGLEPCRANSSLLFVQRGGRIVRDLGYSFQTDRYEAQDLTLLARHIFQRNTIVDWCWQASPHSILWCVLSNGCMAGLTYMPENEVVAWHRHSTSGRVQSCCSLDDSGGRSRLWIVVERQEGVHVEMLDVFPESGVPGWDANPASGYRHLDGMGGYEFPAGFIPCMPEAGMESGSTALRVRKINSVTCRVMNSYPATCKVIDQHGTESRELCIPVRAGMPGKQWTAKDFTEWADWNCPIAAGFREGSKLKICCDGPWPFTVLGLNIAMEVARESNSQFGK